MALEDTGLDRNFFEVVLFPLIIFHFFIIQLMSILLFLLLIDFKGVGPFLELFKALFIVSNQTLLLGIVVDSFSCFRLSKALVGLDERFYRSFGRMSWVIEFLFPVVEGFGVRITILC